MTGTHRREITSLLALLAATIPGPTLLPGVLAQAGQGACTSREVSRIQGALNSGDLELAKTLATRVLLCPEPLNSEAEVLLERIRVRKENTRRAIEARFAVANRQPELACELVLEIQNSEPDFPQLPLLLRETAPCSPRQQEVRRALADALELKERGEYSRAISLLESVRKDAASVPDFEETLLELRNLARQAEQARNVQDLARAKRLVEQRQWEDAKRLLQNLKKSSPSLPGLDELMAQLPQPSPQPAEAAEIPPNIPGPESQAPTSWSTPPPTVSSKRDPRLESLERQLLLATESFFKGAYPQVPELLDPNILQARESDPPAVRRALAYGTFLVASSMASEYLLGGAKDTVLRSRFEDLFRQVGRNDPSFRPDWQFFSPKLRKLFEEVTP